MRTTTRDTRLAAFIAVLTVILGLLPFGAPRALAADPVVTLVGSLQYELGCADDWAPECTATRMTNDGSGTYVYSTDQSPAGTYEFKVALNNSWAENYGANGEPGGANIPVTMTAGQTLTFTWNSTTKVPSVTASGMPAHDDTVWWDGVKHDSRDTLYRTPTGAVEQGTAVTLRLRTYHDDVTSVTLRLYSLDAGGAAMQPMTRVASGVSCADEALAKYTCDYWEYTIPADHPADNLWYRFVVTDGTDTDYYADNTPALDGGVGAVTEDAVDQSYALMIHEPGFTAPAWAKDQVVYQIFPDRFLNGRSNNDLPTGSVRYDDPVIKMAWNDRPEGYCRDYSDASPVTCPWRFGRPADAASDIEQPRGRDYYGGDLKGVDQKLDYLKTLGVSTIYFNPIFDAGSNHSYDTQDYTKIDPAFGTSKDFDNLLKHARQRGMRVVLDGVFNHMSSDSPFFDRYGHYDTVGACESMDSPWRDWFTFKPEAGGPCVGPAGANTMSYEGWFGFDSIPVLTKTDAEVQAYFLTADDAIAKLWLQAGAAGWRLDVSGDASFPDGYWETFRTETKAVGPDSLSISETWQKDSTLLRMIRGDRLDTTMNYRLRDAVLGLLAPQPFNSKGFADSGRQITPTEFANRLASVREDYPDAAYYALLNLLDSHDTERALWTLTDGQYNRERDAYGADDLQRLRMAALIQFTQAGMPSIYYGDEVGVTGADDPDDRHTVPWADKGGSPNMQLYAWYAALAGARKADPALTRGDFRVLLADDANGTVAYGRKTDAKGAVVALNVSGATRTLAIPVGGYLPDGTVLTVKASAGVPTGTKATVAGGVLTVTLPAGAGAYWSTGTTDLAGPTAPAVTVTGEGNGSVSLSWAAVPDAVAYDVYYSPVSGGGYVKMNAAPVTGTTFTVTGLPNAQVGYFVVRAIDAAGNVGAASNEVTGVPHASVGWANLQWPPELTWTLSAATRTDNVYGQIWIEGVTNAAGQGAGVIAQAGYGPQGTAPTASGWVWVDATFNTDAGNNDEYKASFQPTAAGTYSYLYRYSVTGGRDWVYADRSGIVPGEAVPGSPGLLTVLPAADTTAPAVPTGLSVVSAAPTGVELSWAAVSDADLYGYEIGRRTPGAGEFVVIGSTPDVAYTDATVVEGGTYEYAVRAVDASANRSAWSEPVTATAALRQVAVTFRVTVPATTPADATVYIAGSLDRLSGGLPAWNPGGVALTKVDATTWQVTLTGTEGTQVEYKYTLGSWEKVEKDGTCGELGNRSVTLAWGADGAPVVSDTVLNWRNVAPCGN